jgi:hypothetical protein
MDIRLPDTASFAADPAFQEWCAGLESAAPEPSPADTAATPPTAPASEAKVTHPDELISRETMSGLNHAVYPSMAGYAGATLGAAACSGTLVLAAGCGGAGLYAGAVVGEGVSQLLDGKQVWQFDGGALLQAGNVAVLSLGVGAAAPLVKVAGNGFAAAGVKVAQTAVGLQAVGAVTNQDPDKTVFDHATDGRAWLSSTTAAVGGVALAKVMARPSASPAVRPQQTATLAPPAPLRPQPAMPPSPPPVQPALEVAEKEVNAQIANHLQLQWKLKQLQLSPSANGNDIARVEQAIQEAEQAVKPLQAYYDLLSANTRTGGR